jgi:uncharacterized protein (TIGR03437 family)
MTRWIYLLLPFLLSAQELVKDFALRSDPDRPIQRFESPSQFHAVGFLPSMDLKHAHARVRHSADGSGWSLAEDIVIGHEGGTLLWIESGARFLEVSASIDLRIVLIEPKSVTPQRRKAPYGANVESEIVSRADWGCGPECAPRTPPIYAGVTHLVVHHSAGGNAASNWAAVVRSIWVLHVQGNGWNDIGYNYLIDPEGRIYEGRAGGDGVIGAHFSAVNTGTMGVCMIGTFSAAPPTAGALDSLRRLLGWQAAKWKLDPTAQSLHRASNLTLNTVSGHRDAGLSPNSSGATECPGNALYSYLPELRKRVAPAYPACRIEIERRNHCVSGDGASLELRFENPANCAVGAEVPVDWMRIENGRLIVDRNPGPRRSAELRLGELVVQVAQAEAGAGDLPCPSRGAVLNAASFDAKPLGRDTLASVFGENLWREGATVRVLVNNNLPAALLGASPNQINFALPASVNTGSARLVVERDGVRSPETMFWVTEAAPGIFLAQNHADSQVNGAGTPVRAGEPLVVYVTGIGTGAFLAAAPWHIAWDDVEIEGLYLGPTPGFPGLSQANLIVPPQSSLGTHRLRVVVSGVPSREIQIFVVR